MSVFVQAARIIGALTGLGQQGAGLGLGLGDGSGFSAEYIAGAATSGGADFGSLVMVGVQKGMTNYLRNMPRADRVKMISRMGGEKGIKNLKQGLGLISITITIVEMMELTLGFGPPTEGRELETGAQQFATLSAQLKSALPDYRWEGSGSEAYAELDTALQNMAQAMSALDVQLEALVKNQAEWVNHMRLAFGILKNVLLLALIVEMAFMFVPPPAGPIASKAFAITVSALGLAAATSFIGTLLYYSITNGQKANALADGYTELASGATQTGTFAQANSDTSGESSVSSFEAVSNSMSGPSALSALSATPAPAAPAAKGEGSHNERAPLTAQSGAGPATGDGAPEAPTTPDKPDKPDKATPSTPAVTMPTLAQVSAMSGQAAKISGQLSQPAQLVNQAVGQLQQMIQSAQQGQGAAAPAAEAATEGAALTGSVEGAGAGSAAAGAERAPVEAASLGAERPSPPAPAERIV